MHGWLQWEHPAIAWLLAVVVCRGKLFRKICSLAFAICVQQPRALILACLFCSALTCPVLGGRCAGFP